MFVWHPLTAVQDIILPFPRKKFTEKFSLRGKIGGVFFALCGVHCELKWECLSVCQSSAQCRICVSMCVVFACLVRRLRQAMFASFIPEITDILGSRSKYGGSFKKEHGKRYGPTGRLLFEGQWQSQRKVVEIYVCMHNH